MSKDSMREEVTEWLRSLYKNDAIPLYEATDENMEILYELSKSVVESQNITNMYFQDLVSKTSSYQERAEKMRLCFEAAYLGPSCLDNAGQATLRHIAACACTLNLKDPDDTSFLLSMTQLKEDQLVLANDRKKEEILHKKISDSILSLMLRTELLENKLALIGDQPQVLRAGTEKKEHEMNFLGHFPLGLGASHLTSLVNENDDLSLGEPPADSGEISSSIFQSPNVQCFVLNSCAVLSLIQVPAPDVPGGGATAGLTTAPWHVRVIVRDQSGKFCWDCSPLYGPPGCFEGSSLPIPTFPPPTGPSQNNIAPVSTSLSQVNSLSPSSYSRTTRASTLNPPCLTASSLGNKSKQKRLPDELPTLENSQPDTDNLNELLMYIGHTSPECVPRRGNPLHCAPQTSQLEADTVNVIINQRNSEETYVEKHARHASVVPKPVYPPNFQGAQSEFQHCRILLSQLGFMSWEKRPHFDLLKKNEKLVRELRNLDKEKCRETHKIAVIYVGEGQEDKNSVLQNTCGSPAFEAFVAGLGWEVDLETHVGFLGGLQRNGSTGLTAPYYATSFVEVIFHVATRMTSDVDEDPLIKKLRHLGNDEVHIVWSEHTREYRRGIIATEFCDVLIVIYPIKKQLYRIQISRKPEIPFSGPLFDGAIVREKLLPGLVRATAINASMAKRSVIPLSQKFFEVRAGLLETIVKNHKDTTTFEHFAASVYAPSSSRPPRSGHAMFDETSLRPSSSTNLAAALLDSPHTSSRHGSPILRMSPGEHSPVVGGRIGSSPQPPARAHKARERPLSASHSHSSSPLSQH